MQKVGAQLTDKDELRAKDGFRLFTGILPLDLMLTPDGGLRSGCIEIYGPEGVGKTSLVLSIVRSCKRSGHLALFEDVEFALTDELCRIFNVKPGEDFLLKQPDNAEDALNNAEVFLRTATKSVVIIDSIAMLLSQGEWSEKVEDKSFNPTSLMLSKFAKKAPKLCRDRDNVVIYLNQVRDNLSKYGPAEKVPGPRAIKFNTSWRVGMRRIGLVRESGEDGEVVGQQVEFKTVKNKYDRPFQTGVSTLIYGKGFHQGYDLCDLSKALGLKSLVERNGAWFTLLGEHKIQGQAKTADYIVENTEVEKRIRDGILEFLA